MKTLFLILSVSLVCVSLSFSKHSTTQNNVFKGTPVTVDTSSPDSWGYTWIRSDETGGPSYHWLDSTDGWQRVNGLSDDNSIGFFNLGFDFNYYWYTVSKLQVGSNGWLSFQSTIGSINAAFVQFPNSGLPNDVVGPLTGDFDFTDSLVQRYHSRAYFWTNNVDSAVVSWVDAVEWFATPPQPRPTYSFQVILCKTDSSITFQYGPQTGNGTFASESNITMGLENNTGLIGLSYYFASGSIDPTRYTEGIAVRIKKTVETGFQVVDGGVLGGFNSRNGGVFLVNNASNTISMVVKNFGTADLINPRVRNTITRGVTTVLRDTTYIDTLHAGEIKTVTFPRAFSPTTAGAHTGRFFIDITGDLVSSNNSVTTEISVVNFVQNSTAVLSYDDGALDGTGVSAWGLGNEFEVSTQVRIDSAYVRIQTPASPVSVEIRNDDGPGGTPGTLLASKTIASPVAGQNAVYFGGDNVIINGGKFYIGEISTGTANTFAVDQTAPLSNRGWEITSGWGVDRARATEDVMIRAVITPLTTNVNEYLSYLPKGYEMEQNYPNPFNPTTNIKFSIANKSNIQLVVFDILGNEIKTLVNQSMEAGNHSITWNGVSNSGKIVPSGIYFYRLQGEHFSEVKKMMLIK